LKITAEFVASAVSANDLPRDGLAGIALVGRSNVGKSSLINALVRRTVARTSGEPGKTRLANIYRVARGPAAAIYVIDLPGYGFARRTKAAKTGAAEPAFDTIARTVFAQEPAALLLVDARHPGLENDRAAWDWLRGATGRTAVVATKIDKLARGERIRVVGQLESVFEDSVLPVSAVTGEGLDELWKLIDKLVNSPRRNSPSRAEAEPRRQPPTRPREEMPGMPGMPGTAAAARRKR
jgi:GTP-binding protein